MTEGLLKAAEKYFLASNTAQAVSSRKSNKVEPGVRIIGVDPGLAAAGWGVVEVSNGKPKYIAHGCIETSAEESGPVRL